MDGTKNGVNGTIQQTQYGYVTNHYPINTQMNPRVNAQFNYPFENIQQQQVMQSHFMSPSYPVYVNPNIQNSVRPINSASPYNCVNPNVFYSYSNNYTPLYPMPQEIPPASTKVISNEQTTRKFSPLVVTDPSSNTNLDLTKYQNSALVVSDPVLETKPKLNKSEIAEVSLKHNNVDKDSVKSSDTQIENVDKNLNCTLSENIDTKMELCIESTIDNSSITDKEAESSNICLEFKNDTSNPDSDATPVITDVINTVSENQIHSKFENEEEIVACSSEEETVTVESSPVLLNYRLSVNKKESDETTLKRKLIYDREYLIKIKDSNKSRQMPINMPPTSEFSEDIISNTPRTISCQLPESSVHHANIDKINNKKQMPGRQYSGNFKKFNKPPERKYINLEISDTPVLGRSKSGYCPPHSREKANELDDYAKLQRNIKSILNKITPQNFQECLEEITNLKIDDTGTSCLINEIFIKAVKEEAYSVTYAQFCNKVAVKYAENGFKGHLLKKCQDMFETPLQAQLLRVRTEWELKISNESDTKLKSLYESDLEEQVKKAKDKYFGNIRFIGELFLHNLLASKVILNCIKELLDASDDVDAMLALCKLLETCGKQIENKHKDQMNHFIIKIKELSISSCLEKRIKFKLKDICDMRERNWTLRHIQQEKKINPKTLQEQKEEAEAEAAEQASKLAAMMKKRSTQGTPTNNTRRHYPNQNRNLSIKKLTCNSHTLDEKPFLGPPGGAWSSGGSSKSKFQESDGWTIPVSHKPKNNAVRYASNSRSREQSPQVILQNKFKNLESSAEASGADSRSNTPPPVRQFPKAYRVTESIISDEDRSEIIFSDLITTGNLDIESWMKLRHTESVIEKWIDDMMEKDCTCRRYVGDALNKLLEKKKITSQAIIDGTQVFVSSIEDLICDIPKLWEFFAQFLERFIHDKNSDISFFEKIFKSILPSMDVARCFSMALHEASSRLGHKIVGQVFIKSLTWKSIVTQDLEAFIKDNDLEFTVRLSTISTCGGDPLHYIAEELHDMLLNNSSNEKIFHFLEQHVDKPTWKNSEFTRTITTCILKAIKNRPDSSVKEYVRNKKAIIQLISNHKSENEMEILKSILFIASDLKKDTLDDIYDLLIREEIVTSATLQTYLNDKILQTEQNFKLTSSAIKQFK